MEEYEKNNLFATFQAIIESMVEDKRKTNKGQKIVNKFNARINIGLQMSEDYFFWMHLIAENGNYSLSMGELQENYDLEIRATPEDLLYFCNGENSTFHMITKKNNFGKKKLEFSKGTTGLNLFKLLTFAKIMVVD